MTWPITTLSTGAVKHLARQNSRRTCSEPRLTAGFPSPCSNILCMSRWISRLLSVSQAQDIPVIPFCERIISWVSLQVVFSAWAKVLKNHPPHPFVDYCPICLMSVSISASLSQASPSRLPLSLLTHSLYFWCYYLSPANLHNSLTSLAVHMEENIPFYSRLNGGIDQSDKRKRERDHGACLLW